MKNLKKILSLVLALAMALSLMTAAFAADASDYKDYSKVTYKEAVDVMSATGIFQGNNGNFDPAGTLTREQAAKIITYMLVGQSQADKLTTTIAPYSDVAASRWSAGAIAYCTKEGILAGTGKGKFSPTTEVTGLQFAKMLLVALGYDATIEGLTGDSWAIQTSKLALGDADLDNGMKDVSLSNVLTREQAAQMAFNAMKATLVEYEDKGDNITVGGITINTGASKATFVTSKVKADATNISDEKTADGKYTVEFAEKYCKDLKLDTNADDFGRPSDKWTYKNTEVGTYANTDDLKDTFTAEVTAADIYTAVGKTVVDDLKDGKATLVSYVDGKGTTVAKSGIEAYAAKNDSTTVNATGNGDLTEVYVDDDNNVTIVTIRTYVFQASNDYNAKKDSVDLVTAGDTAITLDDKTLDGEDFNIKDIKADDYILVNAVKLANNRYDVKDIAVAEITTGNVDSYKINKNVSLGGNVYKYSATTVSGSDKTRNTQYTVGQDAAIVLDSYGYIIAVDKAVVSSNYVYVSEFAQPAGLSNGKVVAHAYFTDGKTADITVKEAYIDNAMTSNKSAIMGEKSDNAYTEHADWYTYSKNSSDEYSLYAVESKYSQQTKKSYDNKENKGTVVTKNDKVSFLDGVNNIYANDSTIVIVDDGDDVTAYTGVKNIPDIKLTSADSKADVKPLVKTSNGYAYYVFINVDGSASISGNENSNLVYFVEYDGQHKGADNKIYYTYTALDENGAEIAMKADTQLMGTGDIYGVYNKIRSNSDEEMTSVDSVNQTTGKYIAGSDATSAITYTDGSLTLGGKGYTLADNAKITLVVKKSAAILNKDKNADYEATVNMTGKELGDTLKDYTLKYDFAGKVTDTDGSVIEQLFVTVKSASYNGGSTTPSVKGGEIAGNVTVTANNNTFKVVTTAAMPGWDVIKPVAEYTVTINGNSYTFTDKNVQYTKGDATGTFTTDAISGLTISGQGQYKVDVAITFTGKGGETWTVTGSGSYVRA